MHTYFNTLLLPLALLAPSAFSYPGHREPEFKLNNILFNSSYIYSTPAHYATGEGLISFDLTNSAVEYTTHCSATSIREFDFFYGDQTYTCDSVPNVVGSTNFTFSTSGAMAVNQTWTCEEGGHGSVNTSNRFSSHNANLDTVIMTVLKHSWDMELGRPNWTATELQT
jgi:hypothetical protein